MTMNLLRFLPPLVAVLAGCSASHPPMPAVYGNFIKSPIAANDKILAGDAAKQLVALYPPALTRFDLQQVASDPFGYYLIDQLRGQGYALREHFSAGMPIQKANLSATSAATGRLRLGYVIDLAGAPNLYRVTLLVGDQSLTRAYLAQDGSVFPAGAWMRKE